MLSENICGKYKIISSDHFQPIPWSGGITTELFIFPLNSNYSQRNFQFRISTATVDTEKSDFTLLHGIKRKLMVLSGKVTIIHKDHYSKQLEKFDIDEFEGDWQTSSIGRCTDFNLMTTGNTSGELTSLTFITGFAVSYKINEKFDWFFIYAYSGKVNIDINNTSMVINRGDLFVFNELTSFNIVLKAIENSELIFSGITL